MTFGVSREEPPLELDERAPPHQLEEQSERAAVSPVVRALLETSDSPVAVLNAQRQIVAANRKFLGDRPFAAAIGLRTGEALACQHAQGAPGGCGSSEACGRCGALRTILQCLRTGQASEGEALLTVHGEANARPLELRVRASPVVVEGASYVVVSLRDISALKRREALEQVFFHDLLNTLSGLVGWSQVLAQGAAANPQQAARRVAALACQLEREVRDQRALLEAEMGTLRPAPERVGAALLLEELSARFAYHPRARQRRLEVEPPPPGLLLETDRALLLRVLANMVTNALEAVPEGAAVRVSCRGFPGAVCFRVHNEGILPAWLRPHLFQRSFTTKTGKGRGLGTWSMKLLGERYLGGRVGFQSSEADGTVFSIELPQAGAAHGG